MTQHDLKLFSLNITQEFNITGGPSGYPNEGPTSQPTITPIDNGCVDAAVGILVGGLVLLVGVSYFVYVHQHDCCSCFGTGTLSIGPN